MCAATSNLESETAVLGFLIFPGAWKLTVQESRGEREEKSCVQKSQGNELDFS